MVWVTLYCMTCHGGVLAALGTGPLDAATPPAPPCPSLSPESSSGREAGHLNLHSEQGSRTNPGPLGLFGRPSARGHGPSPVRSQQADSENGPQWSLCPHQWDRCPYEGSMELPWPSAMEGAAGRQLRPRRQPPESGRAAPFPCGLWRLTPSPSAKRRKCLFVSLSCSALPAGKA